jgi:hypothetical protein
MAITYEKIASTTLGSGTTNIEFASISSAYTDLKLIFVATAASAGSNAWITFNNDTSALYSYTDLHGNGTTAASSRSSGDTNIAITRGGIDTTLPIFVDIDIFSYAGNTNKTFLVSTSNDQNGSGSTMRKVGLYRSTTAISTIDLTMGVNFAAGSTATLYGILKA